MYADDTSLTLSSNNPADLQYKLNSDLAEIKTWLRANKLNLNVKKPKYSIIGSPNKLANLNYQFDVKIDDHFLESGGGAEAFLASFAAVVMLVPPHKRVCGEGRA